MKSGETWYEVLEISDQASAVEIRQAYYEKARHYHPDSNPGDLAKEWFLQVQQAYETLSDPEKRKEYDKTIQNRKEVKEQVDVNVLTSSETIPRLTETQIIYAILEVKTLKKPERTKVPQGHICLVIDRSTSMKGARIAMVRENIILLINHLRKNDQISIITFNDKADILLTPTPVEQVNEIKEKLDQITCSGSTELYKGLKAGADLLWGKPATKGFNQLILLTDGHTYGDENACYELARKLQSRGIKLSALGIGNEWNDSFLDKLANITGGNSTFISKTEDLKTYIKDLSDSVLVRAAEGVSMDYQSSPGVETSSIFRLQPEVTALLMEKPVPLGELYYHKKSIFLLAFTVPPVSEDQKNISLANGKIRYELLGLDKQKMNVFFDISLPVEGTKVNENPPREILEALSKISIYQMQEKANAEVRTGNLDQAIERLGSISTQLFKLGNIEMAQKVIQEAESLKKDKKYSMDGDKQLKYGTRALISPETEKRES